MPTRAHEWDAGLDLYTPEKVTALPVNDTFPGFTSFIHSSTAATIDTGVHVEIPPGYVGLIKSKSGLNVKHGLITEGVIDSGYTGTIVVKVYNLSNQAYTFEKGDKIAQLLIMPCLCPKLEIVSELPDTERGDGGFGSTGR